MKPENYTLSYDKWNPETGILAELNKPGRIDWGRVGAILNTRCGHCKECIPEWGERQECAACTLYDKNLCGHMGSGAFNIINHMAKDIIPRNKRKARRIGNRIYKQILKDKPEGM
jgi:hypothetical protein